MIRLLALLYGLWSSLLSKTVKRRRKIVITQRTKPIPDVLFTLYKVRFDFLDYDIELPYSDHISEEAIMRDLKKIYRQVKGDE